MVTKARRNTAAYRQRTGLDNVEFRLGEIEHLPVADASVDVVISNCVHQPLAGQAAGLARDRPRAQARRARRRVDLALLRPLPAAGSGHGRGAGRLRGGGGARLRDRAIARDAGLADIRLEQKPEYVASMASFEDPLYQKIAAALPPGTRPADFVTSLNVTARKPE